ncbi:MAG TPA: MoaD/ThiS family protein [Usitatibacteraceae bacterium]|nr:MoaD/ThiS family protein [Usitatibacteraceae bacterium]
MHLPTPLVDYTGGVRDVEAVGATLAALLDDLDRQYPGMRFRMVDEQGQVRAHIRFFVNGELRRVLAAPLRPDDAVRVVAALSGG